jgi:SAM-dependent methyltransferase
MSQAQRHYDDLLAAHYSWMNGVAPAEKAVEQAKILADLGADKGAKSIAIDLGCGPGYQSLALANLGYESVIAIDSSRDLLAELDAAKSDDRIKTVLADLRTFPAMVERGSVNVIACMGDTLTHLENKADVLKLYRDAYDALAPGGHFVLTFRDLSQELSGLDRFLPVRSDDQRIMTCVLEYESESVVVNDLIHVRENGGWTLYKSSYRKLRLSPSAQVAELVRIGFSVDHDQPIGRMHAISARK